MAKKRKPQNKKLNGEWKIVIGILVITFLAFANTLQNDFAYDDWFQIARNPQVTSWENIPKTFTQSVWQFMYETAREPTDLYYRPVFNSLLIVQYQLLGQKVWAWHLVSVLLHLLVVLLVYTLARNWEYEKTSAVIAALIFGLHPVHSEAVAWISSSPDLIAGIFVLASLVCYEWARDRKDGAQIRLRRSWICASLLFALFAMFSKEQAVMLPLFIVARELIDNLLIEVLITGFSLQLFKKQAKACTQNLKHTSFFLIPALIYLTARFFVMGFIVKSDERAAMITFGQMLLTIPGAIFSYTRMLFVPYPLAIVYDNDYVQSIGSMRFWLPFVGVIVIVGLTLWIIKNSSVAIRSFLFLVLFLMPVLNLRFFNQNESPIHDRYLYLPSIGFCFLVALALTKLFDKKVLFAVTASISIIFFTLTFFQNRTWRDDVTLFTHALKFAPNKPFLHNTLAGAYSEINQYNEAEKAYLKALELNPNYLASYDGLGVIYTKQGRHEEAVKAFQKSTESNEPTALAYFNLGSSYINLKKFDEAEKALLKAIEINPSYSPAHYNLGWLYQQRGQKELSIKHYGLAVELQQKESQKQKQ